MRKKILITLLLSFTVFIEVNSKELPHFKNEAEQGLLVEEINNAVSSAEFKRVKDLLSEITVYASAKPDWVIEVLERFSWIPKASEQDYLLWLELQSEFERLVEEGQLTTAMGLAESSLLYSEESFGKGHWLTLQWYRDAGALGIGLGEFESADSFLNEALVLSIDGLGDTHSETQIIIGLLIELYKVKGELADALALQELVIANYEAAFGSNHLSTLEAMQARVKILQLQGNYLYALEMQQELCPLVDESLSLYHPSALHCHIYLANLLIESGRLNEAEATLSLVVANIEKSSGVLNAMAVRVLMTLADLRSRRGDYQVAKEMLSDLINLSRQMGLVDQSYIGKNYLARVLVSEGQLSEAATLMTDVVTYGESAWSQRPIDYNNSLLELGRIYQRQSRLSEAESIFKKALAAFLELAGDKHPSTLVAMNNLGNIYEQLGLYDQAEPLLKQTLSGMEATFGQSSSQTASTRNNLALLHESQGNFREAEPLYLTSYKHLVDQFGKDHAASLAIQNNLAYLYMLMADFEVASSMFEELAERWTILLGQNHQDVLKVRNNLGRAYQKQGKLSEAEQQIYSSLVARRLHLGEKHIDTIRSEIDLGSVYLEQGHLRLAVQQLKLALKLAENEVGEEHPYTFEALNNLARALEALGDIDAAVNIREIGLVRRSRFLDRMLWVTGENAREGYIRLHRPELHEYLANLIRSDDPDVGKKAIGASLQRKGLLLKIASEIEQIAQLSNDQIMKAAATELAAVRKQLAALTLSGPTPETKGRHPEALYELESQVNELQSTLGRASLRYRSTIADVSVEKVAQSLRPNSALVDFLMYDDGDQGKALAGVIINSAGVIQYDIVEFSDSAEIENIVLDYREIIQDDLADEDELLEIGQIAYEIIWGPIARSIEGIDYVYLIPDGVLNILPFNALINGEERYLIETTDLHMLTSGRDLLQTQFEPASGGYIVLAGPDYNADQIMTPKERALAEGRRSASLQEGIRGFGGGLRGLKFAPLPGAEREGQIITDQVIASDVSGEMYIGKSAQEKVLSEISAVPEVLHMATHGFFLEADEKLRKRLLKMQRSSEVQVPPPGDNPLLRSGLAFAGVNSNAPFLGDVDTDNDGVLTALEVLRLNLSGTRLVVLSACETGLGEIHEGEGVYGLRRSFQEAGVAEVISSLWEVSDAGTQALMTDLYGLIVNGMPAREALRQVQIEMLDSPNWGYPYVWSAFMIVGSYESAGMTLQ